MKKNKILKTIGFTIMGIVINTQIALADSKSALTSAKNELDGQIRPIVNSVIVPLIDVVLVAVLVISIGKAVISYKKGHDIELGWILLLIAGIILVSTFPTWGWQLIG